MSSSTLRVPTSFRLPSELLEELKERAKATNCSLNNYVESILTDVMRKDKTVEENVITPVLQDKIDKVREEIHCGQYTTLKSHDDIDNSLRVYDLHSHYIQECRRCHQEMVEIQSKAIHKISKDIS